MEWVYLKPKYNNKTWCRKNGFPDIIVDHALKLDVENGVFGEKLRSATVVYTILLRPDDLKNYFEECGE